METICRSIEFMDVFAENLKLKIGGQEKSKTLFGGVLTFLTICLIAVAAWFIGNDIIYHQNPSISIEEKPFQKRPEMYLDKNSLPIAFTLQDMNQRVYELPSKYFRYDIFTVEIFNQNGSIIIENYEVEICGHSNFPNIPIDDFERATIFKYYCIKNQNITIGGFFDEDRIKLLYIRINMCVDEPHCASKEEINKFITEESNNAAWNIYFQNSIINMKDYLDPVKNYVMNLWKGVVAMNKKTYFIYLKQQELLTDSGIIFNDFDKMYSYSFDFAESDSEQFTPSGALVEIAILAGNRQTIYYRKYIKVQELLSSLGGLLKAIMTISYILSFYFSQMKRDQYILNKIFNFKIDETSMNFSTKTARKTRLFTRSNTSILSSNKMINRIELIEHLEQHENTCKIQFTFLELIKFVFSKCYFVNKKKNKKLLLFEKSRQILDEFLDITNISNKMEEFNKFKLIFLDERQVAMFHFVGKYLITNNPMESSENKINKLRDFSKNKNMLINYILEINDKIRNAEDVSSIDLKLYNMMNPELIKRINPLKI